MDPCKEYEAGVIDQDLILKCIEEQLPKDEAGRLAREEGVPINEVEELRIEYKNILRIDHLWVVQQLTKLCLNNNYIEKIENLDALVNLKELDLSFNKISKIENLDALVNLEKLSLYENFISVLENMDNLKKLKILSLGKNRIDNVDSVLYLRRFLNLNSLNLALNPCAETPDFRSFIAAFLPQLIYYEYKVIKEEEREQGNQIFELKMKNLLEEESKEWALILEKEKEAMEAELHASSFVEYLNTRNLLDSLFENDREGKAFMEMGEGVDEFYREFEEQFLDVCEQIFKCGKDHYAIRQAEIEQFQNTVEEGKRLNQQQSIEVMEAFLAVKEEQFTEIKKHYRDYERGKISLVYFTTELDKFVETIEKQLQKTWKQLMKFEIDLFEQMEEINQNFEHVMTDMINTFIENCQGFFTQLRNIEQTYIENLSDTTNRVMAQMNMDPDYYVFPRIKPLLRDKEVLNNALATSHDIHLNKIDKREDMLVSRAKEWVQQMVTNLNQKEISRNRMKVLEINHFLDLQREAFEDVIDEVSEMK